MYARVVSSHSATDIFTETKTLNQSKQRMTRTKVMRHDTTYVQCKVDVCSLIS